LWAAQNLPELLRLATDSNAAQAPAVAVAVGFVRRPGRARGVFAALTFLPPESVWANSDPMNNKQIRGVMRAPSPARVRLWTGIPASLFGRVAAVAFLSISILSGRAQSTNAPTALPETTVTGAVAPSLETSPVGPYGQPEWTTERRFPGTRVYLQQMPWNVGVEQWVRGRYFRDGTAETRFQEEVEIGLPHRFQLDLYETWAIDQDRRIDQDEASVELRYALADWGKIPLNPTLYLEYAEHNNSPNTLEGKLLLGSDIATNLHWGLNLACEQELYGARNTELAASQGFGYSVLDQKLNLGVEMEYYHEKSMGTSAQNWFLIGPSLQWRPTRSTHLDLAPLIGCTHDSPRVEAYLVFGYDFGIGTKKERYAPTSLRGQ
jgi:hypothetical protein